MRDSGSACAPPCLGKSKPRGEAQARKPPARSASNSLAAEEMGAHARRAKPVGAIEIERGAVAARRPAGEIEQRLTSSFWRCGQREQLRTDGAGIGEASPAERPRSRPALTAVRTSPRSSLPISANGQPVNGNGAPLLLFSRVQPLDAEDAAGRSKRNDS